MATNFDSIQAEFKNCKFNVQEVLNKAVTTEFLPPSRILPGGDWAYEIEYATSPLSLEPIKHTFTIGPMVFTGVYQETGIFEIESFEMGDKESSGTAWNIWGEALLDSITGEYNIFIVWEGGMGFEWAYQRKGTKGHYSYDGIKELIEACVKMPAPRYSRLLQVLDLEVQ